MHRRLPRIVLVRLLLVATSVLLVATTIGAYAWRALFDTEQFGNRATAALQDPDVRQAVGERVTDDLLLRAEPDLLAARPILSSAVAGIVGGDAFAALFRRAATDAHRAVFERDSDTVALTIADVGVLAAEALRQLRPKLAEQLEEDRRLSVVDQRLGGITGDLARIARQVRAITFVLALLTLACAAAAVALARDRRATVARLGVAMIAAGVAVVAATVVARAIALGMVDDGDRDAAGAVWDAFAGDLRTTGWLLAGAGAVTAAAAASLVRPIEVEEPLKAAWRIATREPDGTRWRVVRGIALVAAGAVVIAEAAQMVVIAVTLAGVYLLYKGVEALLRAIGPAPEPAERPARRPARRLRLLAVPVVAAALVAAGGVALAGGGALDEPAPAVEACNGHVELCDRRLDDVTLPATHNAMSVPLRGWFSSLQERPIGEQLEDGIRGLLLDTHYADRLANGRTRTVFTSAGTLGQAVEQDAVSPHSVAAAERLRDRLGFRGRGERGMYLCHTFCELGSTPLAPVLEDIRDFLVTHPGDVLVVINQDYVTPAGLHRRGGGRRPRRLRVRAAARGAVADARRADRARPAARAAGRERRGRGALVPARIRARDAGHAVHVQAAGGTDRPGPARCELRAQPRPGGRAAAARQPLGQHRSGPAAQPCHRRQRPRAAAAARPRLRGRPGPAGEPARGRLLPARGPVRGRRRAQRRRALTPPA